MARTNCETVFRSLADPTRLRLLNLLRNGEACVCYLVDTLDAPQPRISQHLANLRRAGLVEARRDGKWMHYRLGEPNDPALRRILTDTLQWVTNDAAMQRDLKRLNRVCSDESQGQVELRKGPGHRHNTRC